MHKSIGIVGLENKEPGIHKTSQYCYYLIGFADGSVFVFGAILKRSLLRGEQERLNSLTIARIEPLNRYPYILMVILWA